MQSHNSRSTQRRTPVSGGGGSSIDGSNSMSRNSYGATRSPSIRTETNLSKIEESVTNLLRATKELLETLTKWSRNSATEQEVSDIYVKLGSHFNIACRAFTAIGVETSDLGNVPDVLRTVLENTLSQDATPASLEVYLPRIREIIIDLLQGLRRKQKKLGPRAVRQEPQNGNSRPSGSETLRQEPPQQLPHQPQQTSRRPRQDEVREDAAASGSMPIRSSSLPMGAQGTQNGHFGGSRTSSTAGQRPPNIASGTMSSHQNDPYGHRSRVSVSSDAASEMSQQSRERQGVPSDLSPPPPPPPPKQDALEALSRADTLERRASRRYSAYHIAKQIGSSPGGMAMLPGGTPMRDSTRESMQAVRNRQSAALRDKAPPKTRTMSTLSRPGSVVTQVKEEEASDEPDTVTKTPITPIIKTPDDKLGPSLDEEKARPASTSNDVVIDTSVGTSTSDEPPVEAKESEVTEESSDTKPAEAPTASSPTAEMEVGSAVRVSQVTDQASSVTSSEPASKEITIFLQLGRSVKKVPLQDGLDELSLNTLRLLFISKFNYSPPSGDDFPEIYLQDTASGVRYELEDMQDVKDRSVLCLNVEVLDEVKRHIDDGMSGLRKMVENVHKVVESQAKVIQLVAERQEDTSKKVTELSVRGPSSPIPAPTTTAAMTTYNRFGGLVSPPIKRGSPAQVSELQAIKTDLKALRGTYNSFCQEMKTSFADTKRKAVARIAEASGLASEGRLELDRAKKNLGSDTDNLVSRVDDLQDTIEDLRKDVVTRGVRPRPRVLEDASKEIVQARKELKKMSDYIKNGKPQWKKVWERELELVCEDQQFFNLQEELVADLQDDLNQAFQTFELVEQCTEQQLKSGPGAIRSLSRGFVPIVEEPLDPSRAKDNMLLEVRALRPNHENRIEAIERAEKARQKELEGRTSPFKQELGQFVEENRLKKTAGGISETERLRMLKDEEMRRGIYTPSPPPAPPLHQEGSGAIAEDSGQEISNGVNENRASLSNSNDPSQGIPVLTIDAASDSGNS